MNNQDYKTLLDQFKNAKSEEDKHAILNVQKKRIFALSKDDSLRETQFLITKTELIENKLSLSSV